jgi:cytochrome b involved in lipid metabolism
MMYAGQDATEGFDSQMHSEDASRIKEKYYIG